MVDVYHKVSGRQHDALLPTVRKDSGRRDVGQQSLLFSTECFIVFRIGPYSLCQLLQMGIRGDIGMKPRYATHSGRHFVGDGSVEKRHDRFFHEIDSDLIKTIFYI